MKALSKSRLYLLGLFAVFFIPMFIAMWMYFGAGSWFTLKSQNHGVLIQPPRPLNEFSLTSNDAATWTHEEFLGKWTIMYLGDGQCDLYCEASLFKMRQVQLTLGRDSQRVQRKFLGLDDGLGDGLGNNSNSTNLKEIFKNYPKLQNAWFDPDLFRIHLPQFKDLDGHSIYIIDPLGNLMMYYSKYATSKGIKKDLKRLLKVSRIG